MSKFVGVIAGAAVLAVGILSENGILVFSGAKLIGAALITAGAGAVLSGIGTLIQGSGSSPVAGIGIASRNPVTPWTVIYGCVRTRGALVWTDISA